MNPSLLSGRRVESDDDWHDLKTLWHIRPDTTYLNHGSFGPSPEPVRGARRAWLNRCDEQPMDFYVRELEPGLWRSRQAVARLVGTSPQHLVLMENATAAMNVVADSFPLRPGDEILLNDHEYGAVHRIWERRALETGARVVVCRLPLPIESADQIVDALVAATSDRTRLLVGSHITSPTAIVMPMNEVTARFKELGIAIGVDGPHALAQIDVEIDRMDWDFYCASCHKWLCAPLGTGFLFVHPRWQRHIRWPIQSWGRLLPAMPERWDEQFTWTGTRDASGYLALADAVEFMEQVGLENFRRRCYWLAREFEQRLVEHTGHRPLAPQDGTWYGTMCHVPLPPGDWSVLQDDLWRRHGIEVPIVHFDDRWFIRVSSHLYNTVDQIEKLVSCLPR